MERVKTVAQGLKRVCENPEEKSLRTHDKTAAIPGTSTPQIG